MENRKACVSGTEKIMECSWNQQGHNDNHFFCFFMIIVPKSMNPPTISMNEK